MSDHPDADKKTVFRSHLTCDFVQLPNAMLRDRSLSYKARGILAMLLSNKDTWEVNKGYLQEMGTEGREAIQSAICELEARGYMRYLPQGRDGGKFVVSIWHVYDTPCPINERTNQTKWRDKENFKNSNSSVSHHEREPVHGEPQTANRERQTVNGFPTPKNTSTQNTNERTSLGESSPTAPEVVNVPKDEHLPHAPSLPKTNIISAWNELVPSLPSLVSISGKREASFRARWAEQPDLEAWKGHFAYIEATDFLAGRCKTKDSKFQADFDWLIKPSNFQKIRERKYKQETKNVQSSEQAEKPKGFFAGLNLKPKPPHETDP